MENEPPKLIRTRANRHSTIKSGRTIGERREKLETASERAAARDKVKKHQKLRVIFTSLGFVAFIALIIFIFSSIFKTEEDAIFSPTISVPYAPTIEVVDAETGLKSDITGSMKEYIGQAEADFRESGYIPTKVVRPIGSVREVDFYLDGYTGYIKLTTDRASGVSVEDADRMIKYLLGINVADFSYIDVRIDRKAYWKPLE